jgi:hypothetical protein
MGGEQAPSWADGYEKDQILLPNPEIHPLLRVGFLFSHKFAVRDDVVGLHGVGRLVLGNRDPTGQPFRELCES